MTSDPTAAATTDREFVHSRLIEAPREQVFAAMADPARLARRWGAEGFSSTFHTPVEKQRVAAFVAPADEQTLDRLAAEALRSTSSP